MDQKNNRINKSLKFSFLEGIFASGMIGFTQEYFTPFLLLLGGTVKHVGILHALPNFLASLVQLKSADLTEKIRSRKKTIIIFVFLQAVMLFPMLSMAFLEKAYPGFFISLVILFASFGALANPAWGSLISDLVPAEKRGEYFGWRNRNLGFIVVITTFIAGLILHEMGKIKIFYGFGIIFILAFIFRIFSWCFLKKMSEPSLEFKKENYFSLYGFLARLKESNFARFVLFVSLMSFSVNLAAPFFAVLMLKNLSFSYFLYTFITVSATLTVYATIGRWGKHADRFGNLKVIKFTAPLIGIIPLLWILSQKPVFLFFAQLFSGFIWAGFNLCTSNFIYDAVTPEKRTRCISYFNLLNGLASSTGAILGGFLVQKLPSLFGYKILTLFLISSILRLFIGLTLPKKLKEVRPIEKVKSTQLFFSMIGIRPILGIERKTLRY